MRTVIEVIPHEQQRYNTIGDWYLDRENDVLHIKVSFLGNWKMEYLIGEHENIEANLCLAAGITDHDVDVWDTNFKGEGEPGDDPKCPYHRQHLTATHIERELARRLKVDWQEYEQKIEEVYDGYETAVERQS